MVMRLLGFTSFWSTDNNWRQLSFIFVRRQRRFKNSMKFAGLKEININCIDLWLGFVPGL